MKIDSDLFFQVVRSALNHLYDPYFLRASPLVKWFDLGDRPDTPAVLQRILSEAINELQPREGDPNAAQKRRSYELILYRYVHQLNQEEVANQFGLSVRHLRREQNAAIVQLAANLWNRYRLGSESFVVKDPDSDDPSGIAPAAPPQSSPAPSPGEPRRDDLSWLSPHAIAQPANLGQVLAGVIDLSRNLMNQYQVNLSIEVPADLPPLAVEQVALRQILLTLFSVAICGQTGATLQINAEAQENTVQVTFLCASPGAPSREISADDRANIDLAAQFSELFGGHLSCSNTLNPFQASLQLPVFQPQTVLVIDDNADFIQLIERYLTGTTYRVAGERNPALALAAAEKHTPAVILLDVMMPHIDGWEVLGRLRTHPATASIPIMVCTILPQEELALSLGASAYLRKPISQERLLTVLEQLTARAEQSPH